MKLTEEAKKAKKAYFHEYYLKNKEKLRKYQAEYWKRRSEKNANTKTE